MARELLDIVPELTNLDDGRGRHELGYVRRSEIDGQNARLEPVEDLLGHVILIVAVLEREVEGVSAQHGVLSTLAMSSGGRRSRRRCAAWPRNRIQAASGAIDASPQPRREALDQVLAPVFAVAVASYEDRARLSLRKPGKRAKARQQGARIPLHGHTVPLGDARARQVDDGHLGCLQVGCHRRVHLCVQPSKRRVIDRRLHAARCCSHERVGLADFRRDDRWRRLANNDVNIGTWRLQCHILTRHIARPRPVKVAMLHEHTDWPWHLDGPIE